MTLYQFQADLMSLEDERVLDRWYYSGTSHVLNNDQTAELRRKVADFCGIAMRDVIIVGSAKLGFTLTNKPNRPVFSPFCDESDIDLAIISSQLYLKYWKISYRYWLEGGNWDKVNSFRKYMFRGWFRPDLLPSGEDYPEQREWWEFFRLLKESGEFGHYSINAGVYFDEDFWGSYAKSTFNDCRDVIKEPL